MKTDTVRRRLFETIEPARNHDKISFIYDFVMIATIIVSVIPLAFKEQNLVFAWIERVAVVIFSIDYLLRLLTADLALPGRGKLAFFVYPFKPMALINLLSILPSLLLLGNSFVLLRTLRLLRTIAVLRIFKLFRYSKSFSRVASIEKQKSALLTVGYILISALVVFLTLKQTLSMFFDAVYLSTISITTMGYDDNYKKGL